MAGSRLVLASISPRRLELLAGLGLAPRVLHPEVDETRLEQETAPEHAARLARAKARSVASRIEAQDAVVLGADTVVAQGGALLGKPRDDADARSMLRLLSGRVHEVFTAVHVLDRASGREAGVVESTRVRFRALDERTIEWYVSTGEPRDKAGAYSIQGRGCLLTVKIDGSWSNVVGLPLEALPELFARIGIDLLELQREGALP